MEQGSGCRAFTLRCGRALDVVAWAGGVVRKQEQGAQMTLPCAGYLMGPSNVAPEKRRGRQGTSDVGDFGDKGLPRSILGVSTLRMLCDKGAKALARLRFHTSTPA